MSAEEDEGIDWPGDMKTNTCPDCGSDIVSEYGMTAHRSQHEMPGVFNDRRKASQGPKAAKRPPAGGEPALTSL